MASTLCSFEQKGSASTALSATSLLLHEVNHCPCQLICVEAAIKALAREGAHLHHFFLSAPHTCPALCSPTHLDPVLHPSRPHQPLFPSSTCAVSAHPSPFASYLCGAVLYHVR